MLDLSLDHVGVGMRDLETGRIAFDRLGFRLTARSLHAGSPSAGAPVVPWGSGNHCAMFEHGYLEVLGLTDPDRYSSVKDMVSRYEGLHIVALGCADADATHGALVAAGVPAETPRALERDAAFGPADEEVRRARFKNIYLERERYPEARFLCIEHLTREVLWQPHLMHHPNGALALEAVYFCAEDLAATAAKISAVVGVTPHSAPAAMSSLRWRVVRCTSSMSPPGAPQPASPYARPRRCRWDSACAYALCTRPARFSRSALFSGSSAMASGSDLRPAASRPYISTRRIEQ